MKNKSFLNSFILVALSVAFLLAFMVVGTGADKKEKPNTADNVYVPILMYHSMLKDSKLKNNYTITPKLFENDLKFFCENGYTTITVNDLVDYVYSDEKLPQKCVMLTFDDGYYNNYYYAYPLLKKYKCKAVISPIASMTKKFTETQDISINYGHISVDDIKEMTAAGYVEIQNHSYDMHSLSPRKGISQKKGESLQAYTAAITNDITKAQEYLKKNAKVTPDCFVYPFGEESSTTFDTVKKLGFVCTLTCTEKPNVITKDKNSLFELGRYLRKPNENILTLMNRINKDYQKVK